MLPGSVLPAWTLPASMFPASGPLGSPAPLRSTTPLLPLVAQASRDDPLGVWLRGCRHLLRLRVPPARWLLAGPDLGALIRRCRRIAVRIGHAVAVVEAERLIAWRTLQVATRTPHLPSLERLRAHFPGAELSGSVLEVPLGSESPEAVLAACVAEQIAVSGSRISYGSRGRQGGGGGW